MRNRQLRWVLFLPVATVLGICGSILSYAFTVEFGCGGFESWQHNRGAFCSRVESLSFLILIPLYTALLSYFIVPDRKKTVGVVVLFFALFLTLLVHDWFFYT